MISYSMLPAAESPAQHKLGVVHLFVQLDGCSVTQEKKKKKRPLWSTQSGSLHPDSVHPRAPHPLKC